MKFNLNDYIIVTLTPAGEAAWTKYLYQYADYGSIVPKEVQKTYRLSDGKVQFQLWEAMNIFGSDCYNGSKTLPFVGNALELKSDQISDIEVMRIPESEGLDPVTVTWENFELGKGRVTIVCGSAWTHYWNAMGDYIVQDFFASCGNDYLTGKLGCANDSYLLRICKAIKAELKKRRV
jgi:hypothetical protein